MLTPCRLGGRSGGVRQGGQTAVGEFGSLCCGRGSVGAGIGSVSGCGLSCVVLFARHVVVVEPGVEVSAHVTLVGYQIAGSDLTVELIGLGPDALRLFLTLVHRGSPSVPGVSARPARLLQHVFHVEGQRACLRTRSGLRPPSVEARRSARRYRGNPEAACVRRSARSDVKSPRITSARGGG